MTLAQRNADQSIESIFINRWSPRAFNTITVSEQGLMTMFEAARWAPSAFNVQPWRFLYATRDAQDWSKYTSFLDEFNRKWATKAAALIVVLSDQFTEVNGELIKSSTHSFDTGAACLQLALQATSLGYQAHAMAGIQFEKIRDTLAIDERYKIEIMIAIGKQGDAATLPADLQANEQPSLRKAINEISFAGNF